eukprot:g2547.t1
MQRHGVSIPSHALHGVYANLFCNVMIAFLVTVTLFQVIHLNNNVDGTNINNQTVGNIKPNYENIVGEEHRKLKHIPTHPDVFDPSYKRRGDVDDEENLFLDEEIDLTDYSPWYFTYVNSTNLTIDPWRTATGNIRMCNVGEVPRPTKDMYCMENRLNKSCLSLS